jgi:phage terminase small subunit
MTVTDWHRTDLLQLHHHGARNLCIMDPLRKPAQRLSYMPFDDIDEPSAEALASARRELSDAQAAIQSAEEEMYSHQPQLSPRRGAFVREYLKDRNATLAAIRAGYEKALAESIGAELLKDPEVGLALDIALSQRTSAVEITPETILNEMALLALSRLEHYTISDDGQVIPAPGAPVGVMAALQSVKRKVKVHYDSQGNIVSKDYDVELRLWDKPAPLRLLGRHVGLFPDKVEHTGAAGGPIQVQEVRSVIVDPAANPQLGAADSQREGLAANPQRDGFSPGIALVVTPLVAAGERDRD